MKKLLLLSFLIFSARGATLVSRATGNLTASGTWGTVDSGSLLDSEAGSTACTTSQVNSSNFTPGALTTDGVAVKLAARVASPTGTITITLRNTTAASNVTSTTVNVSQLPSSGNGWQFFKWGSSQLLLAATNYAIGFQCSVNAEATLFRDGTAGNWSRLLSTTTTAAPGANDILHIMGELTGAGTSNAITVTMDQTATTSFGTTTPPQSFTVDNLGTLTWGTTASTNYKLAHAGVFACYGGGAVNVGTSGTRMPSTSTAIWTATVASNVDSGWVVAGGCVFNAYGATKTTISTLMTADKVATNTVIAVASTAGWANSDVLAFSSTTRTPGQAESKIISTVDSGTQVTLTAGLTNNHSGTSPTQAEVINLTRNVVFTGTSTSLQGYLTLLSTANFHADYAEFKNLGSGTASKRGIDIQTTSGGTASFNACSIHDLVAGNSMMFYISGAASDGASLTSNVWYNSNHVFQVDATSGTWTISGNVFILPGAGTATPTLNDIGGTFTNNTISSAGSGGLTIGESANLGSGGFSGNTIHSTGSTALLFNVTVATAITTPLVISNTTIWRSNSWGMLFIGNTQNVTIDGFTAFGNTTANLLFNALATGITINSMISSGDSTFSTAEGIRFANAAGAGNIVTINNSTFGVVSGIKTAHSTGDLNFYVGSQPYPCLISGSNSTFASASAFPGFNSATGNCGYGSSIGISNYGQVAGDNRFLMPNGNSATDTSIFRTASPSVRITPNATNPSGWKVRTGYIYIPVASGATPTLSAYVRKSVVGDGAAYNGSSPRLMVMANPQAGSPSYDHDNICAQGGGTGSFTQISCTLSTTTGNAVLVAYIDADGTAGWVNVSDIAVTTTAPSIGNPTYFTTGQMFVAPAGGSGGSFTFVQ